MKEDFVDESWQFFITSSPHDHGFLIVYPQLLEKKTWYWYINCFLSTISFYETIFLLSKYIASRLNRTTLSGNKEIYVVPNRRRIRRRKERERKKEKELPPQKLWKFPISLLALFLSRSIHSFVNINALSSRGCVYFSKCHCTVIDVPFMLNPK